LLAKTAQVLGNGSQCELELRSARSAQSQPAKSQDALQMSEQHLDTLALAARSLEGLRSRTRCSFTCFGSVMLTGRSQLT
jgi:hypothetical protein